MRKRLAIAGHSVEGLSLIPLLEANPEVEICAILTDAPQTARDALEELEPRIADAYASRITTDREAVLRAPNLVAVIDADTPSSLRDVLIEAPDLGVQVTTPLIAKLLFAFGPVDAARKPDLLQALGEILESYNLTIDRRGLLNRILQIAVGATGADRGSLMLWDPQRGRLCVEVAIGIEKELLPKIRIRPGEGIAGRAFEDRRALLITGKADHERYRITRERSDVESAISAPLVHGDRVLGVLNLAHGRRHGAFNQEDLEFVERLARIDARILTRAEEYHALQRDSVRLRAQGRVREILGSADPLPKRLSTVCGYIASELEGGICHVYLRDPELGQLDLRGSSIPLDPLSPPLRIPDGEGIHGWVTRERKPVVMSSRVDRASACVAILPLVAGEELLGVISFEGTRTGDPEDSLRERISVTADALGRELADALRALRIERDATKTAAINEVVARMAQAADTPDLHRTITSAAAMILESEHAVLRIQDPASGRFQIRSYFGSADVDSQGALFDLEKDLSIAAIQHGAPLRVVDLDHHPVYRRHGASLDSAIAAPLRRDGRTTGTLSVLGKVSRDFLGGERFTRQDEVLLARLVEQAQRAIERVQEREWARHHQRFDDLTGLPNAAQLAQRIDEEIARAASRGEEVALIHLRLDGLAPILAEQEQTEGNRLVVSIAQDLRAAVREFDVVARTAPDTFEILVPEPEGEITSLIGTLARRANEAIRRESPPETPRRLPLEIGYSVYPREVKTARALIETARTPRVATD